MSFIFIVITSISFFVVFVYLCFFIYFFKREQKWKKWHENSLKKNIFSTKDFYDFNIFGLVLVDNDGLILWVNHFFVEKNIELKKNIFEWKQELRILKNKDDSVKIVINSIKYEVTFLPNQNIYIFKDINELEFANTKLIEKDVVLGVVNIDNYFFVDDSSDSFNENILKIENAIFEYCDKYKLFIRKYRNDSYFIVCNFNKLKEIQFDKFSLIKKVRNLKLRKTSMPLTLSICFVYNFPDFDKVAGMIDDVVNVVKNRGGDQAAIYRYGNKMVFFGGKTENLEKSNKIQARDYANLFVNIIKNFNDVLILSHKNMDMDGIGGCLAILSLCQYFKKNCHIVFDDEIFDLKIKEVFNFLNFENNDVIIKKSDALNSVNNLTLVILVDCNCVSNSLSPEIFDKAANIVVIDHHIQGVEKFKKNPLFLYIETSAASVIELIIELIIYSALNPKINIDKKYATIMLSGIFLDSNFFKKSAVSIRTFEAAKFLIEFDADKKLAIDFLKNDFDEYKLINELMLNLKKPFENIVYCLIDKEDDDKTLAAKIADKCMSIKNINISFAIKKLRQNKVYLSCRSNENINVQLLAEKMGGGGHLHSAAVLFENKTLEEVEKILLNNLKDFVNDK